MIRIYLHDHPLVLVLLCFQSANIRNKLPNLFPKHPGGHSGLSHMLLLHPAVLTVDGFSKLRDLYCRGNRLTSLDISNNPVADRIDCSENPDLAIIYIRRISIRRVTVKLKIVKEPAVHGVKTAGINSPGKPVQVTLIRATVSVAFSARHSCQRFGRNGQSLNVQSNRRHTKPRQTCPE
jgi:hypothetical protein